MSHDPTTVYEQNERLWKNLRHAIANGHTFVATLTLNNLEARYDRRISGDVYAAFLDQEQEQSQESDGDVSLAGIIAELLSMDQAEREANA